MKHLWLLNHYAQEPGGAGGTRHLGLAKHLLGHGWKTTLIGSSVEHVTGRQRLRSGEKWRRETHDGVDFVWIRGRPYSDNGIARILGMIEYALGASMIPAKAGLPAPDAVIGSSVHPLAAWAGMRLAKRRRIPFLFEVRDLWPETLIEMGRLNRGSLVASLMYGLESRLCRAAARVLYLPPGAATYFEARGVPAHKLVALPNGVDLSGYPAAVPPPSSGRFTVMYLGAHGQANALDTVVRAASMTPEIAYRFVGDGPEKEALQSLAAGIGASNVVFEPPVPKEAVAARAQQADAFVLSVRNLPGLYRYGISMNKLFDYFAAARPIVLASAAINDPVTDARAGITVPPEDPAAMAQAVRQLAAMTPEERWRMGAAGRKYVEARHSYERLAETLAHLLDDVTASR